MEYDEVIQPLRGDQGHIGRIKHSDACEPWGYVAPAVAAVMTRATGVRHIYLIGIYLMLVKITHVPN